MMITGPQEHVFMGSTLENSLLQALKGWVEIRILPQHMVVIG